MPQLFSERFGKSIVITDHARGRMIARAISETLLRDMIETGEVRGSLFVVRCSLIVAGEHASEVE